MSKRRLPIWSINPPVARFRLHVRTSPIAGLGVFAREGIPPRRLVIEYGGDRITIAEAERRQRKRGNPERICFAWLKGKWVIDGWKGNGAQYVNHSCDPNLYSCKLRGHILFFSARRIRTGEELTIDYRISSRSSKVTCHCGSPHCRGVMNHTARRRRRRRGRRKK